MDDKIRRKRKKGSLKELYYCNKYYLKFYTKLSFCRETQECADCSYRGTDNESKGDRKTHKDAGEERSQKYQAENF